MKKYLIALIAIISILFITSCSNNNEVKIIVPNGSPALAQSKIQYEDKEIAGKKINVSNVGASVLVSAFASEEYDIIYAPSDLGIKMYNNNQKYVYIANVTWGNIYIATGRSGDFTLENLNGQDVFFFGENQVQSMIVNKVLENNKIQLGNITYLDDTASTKEKLLVENDSIVLIAQPVLTAVSTALEKKGITVQTIDVLSKYEEITGGIGYPQAGVFAKATFVEKNIVFIEKYLEKLEESCKFVNEKPLEASNYAESLKYGLPVPNILKNAIPACNILFKKAKDSKEAIIKCYENNLIFIGGKLPDEKFYAY